MRASYDLQCPEENLEVTEIDDATRGVRGCGQQVVYVEACPKNRCTWILNSDSRPAPGSESSRITGATTSSSESGADEDASENDQLYSNLAPEEPFPVEAAGFQFGATPEEAQSACEGAGHEWSDTDTGAACSGLPKEVGSPGKSLVRFCGGKLCRLGVAIAVGSENLSVPLGIWSSLNKKYGKPVKSRTKVPATCKQTMYQCIESGEAVMNNIWRWNDDSKVTAKFEKKGDVVYLMLYYVLPMTEVPDPGKGAPPPADYSDTF